MLHGFKWCWFLCTRSNQTSTRGGRKRAKWAHFPATHFKIKFMFVSIDCWHSHTLPDQTKFWNMMPLLNGDNMCSERILVSLQLFARMQHYTHQLLAWHKIWLAQEIDAFTRKMNANTYTTWWYHNMKHNLKWMLSFFGRPHIMKSNCICNKIYLVILINDIELRCAFERHKFTSVAHLQLRLIWSPSENAMSLQSAAWSAWPLACSVLRKGVVRMPTLGTNLKSTVRLVLANQPKL